MTHNDKNIQELRQKIEQLRNKLKTAVEEKGEFTQEEVIDISQKLDDLLNKLYDKLE